MIKAPLQVGAALMVPLSQLLASAFIFSGVEQTQGKGLWMSCAVLLVAEPLLRSPELLLWDRWVWVSELWETRALHT